MTDSPPPDCEAAIYSVAGAEFERLKVSVPAIGQPLVVIRPDGTLEFGPDYEPDAAARIFWEAVQRFAPMPVSFPLPDRAALRDRIASALEAAWQDHYEEGYGLPRDEMAAAVLGVLPPPADRAATLRELEQRQRPNTPPSRPEPRADAITHGVPRVARPLDIEHDELMARAAAEHLARTAAEEARKAADRAAVLREAAEAVARYTGNDLDANAQMLRRLAAETQQTDTDQDGALIDEYLRHLRGQGPEPDLSNLPPEDRAKTVGQFEIVRALADRDPELPPLAQDPVARRLGLHETGTQQTQTETRDGDPTERRDRYAAAMARARRDSSTGAVLAMDRMAAAAVAIADAEQAELRARVARLEEEARLLLEQRQEMAEERFAWQERGDRAERRAEALDRAMRSTAADAAAHRFCHMKLMAQCQRAERAEGRLSELEPADAPAVPVEAAADDEEKGAEQ